jgi:hypothetical protein
LAKVDKSQYTKEQWHKIREQRRLEKAQQEFVKNQAAIPNNRKYYILCLKHGVKYSSEYVNKLYNMVKRHCTLDYDFVCLTDDKTGIHPDVITLPLPRGITGWWCKPYMYSKDLPIKGTILYLDLDVVVASNIDKLLTWSPDNWCTVRDFTRVMRPKWQKYNSSIVRFKTGELDFVWTEFEKNKDDITKRLHGDQDWLYEATRKHQAMLYPDSWIQSWKWEVRSDKTFAVGGIRGKREFMHDDHHAKPRVECCVCVFHGDPNPAYVRDKWVVDNWK